MRTYFVRSAHKPNDSWRPTEVKPTSAVGHAMKNLESGSIYNDGYHNEYKYEEEEVKPDPKWDFSEPPQAIGTAIREALGAASVCWETMSGAGVFQEDQANAIAKRLEDFIYGLDDNFWKREARSYANDVAYWRERAQAAEGKLDRIKALATRELHNG